MKIGDGEDPRDLGKAMERGGEMALRDVEDQQFSCTHSGDVEPMRRRIEALVIHSPGGPSERKIGDMLEPAEERRRIGNGLRMLLGATGTGS
jgi:hypothetical protein